MSKPLSYWREKWKTSEYMKEVWGKHDDNQRNSVKTLDLLSEYSAFFKFPVAWGGPLGRFFSGRWNTHFGSEVQKAISDYFSPAGYYANSEKCHSVEFIIALVKKEIGAKVIDENGDLARILQVVKENTSIDYFQINADAIFTSYTKNPTRDYINP